MVLLFTETNERSCINFYPSISQNLEREKSEKEKGLTLPKVVRSIPPERTLILTRPSRTIREGRNHLKIMKDLRLRRKKQITTELYLYRYMMFSILGFCIGYFVGGSI